MYRTVLIIALFWSTLFSNSLDDAINAYNNKSYKQAFTLFKELAKDDDLMSIYRLAVMYEKGLGTDIDKQRALFWHQKAAKKGHAVSQYILAKKYEQGDIFDQDFDKSFYWYEKSANQGYSESQFKLSMFYLKGINRLKDLKIAKHWMEKAYKGGSILAEIAWNRYGLWKY